MARSQDNKACRSCASAKRKCGRQTPHCLRCKRRGVECVYSPPKSAAFILYGTGKYVARQETIPAPLLDLHFVGEENATLLSAPPTFLIHNPLASWFTSPETWTIHRFPRGELKSFCTADLNRILAMVYRWLMQWIEKGSCPFIHSRVYQERFPRCVQDAYTTLLSYKHKTVANEQLIFQIVYDRAKQLVMEHAVVPSEALDPLEHIARVHALLVYQFIGFQDGDIRLRHLAESHIPVMESWMEQTIEHASQTECLGVSLLSLDAEALAVGLTVTDTINSENLLWYSWILSETIRRTYHIVSGIQGMFVMVQQSRRMPCLGGTVFTTREGIWEAKSAFDWEKVCAEKDVGLMPGEDAERLLVETTPDEVNDFARGFLQTTFGVERIERWGAKIQE